ncbi:MAG TPA: YigZ family protein, partial [Candidatus Blautia merdavium]|nr:YigZ family protein [Candidatus Blautia merdavium]
MLEQYKTIYEGGEGEIVEKKSRFIATTRLVKSEEEAAAFLEEMRKKYWDATHNCFAYVIGERREIVRCSDDGEPSGTAGRPMLDVLLGEEMYDTAVVVTRYFGGNLLGTGGLVRAYAKAVQEGLACSRVITKYHGVLAEVDTDYNGVGKLQYLFAQREIPVMDAQYTEA